MKFYEIREDYNKNEMQFNCKSIKNELPFLIGKKSVSKPLIFKYTDGTKRFDVINIGWSSLFLLSNRIFDAFVKHNITGWKKYPSLLFDNEGIVDKNYSLLGVTGKSGKIDYKLSDRILKEPPIKGGKPYYVLKGLNFDIATWDGSDIFIPKNSLFIIITEKLKNLLEDKNCSNLKIQSIDSIEISDI